MDVRNSPRLQKSPSTTASSSSTGRLEEREVQEEEGNNTNNHTSKQINNLISTYFTPPKLKPILAKRPVAKLKSNSSATTVEKSQAEEKPKKKEDSAGAGRRVWTDADEILLLKYMGDYVKRGENPNSAAFYESIQNKISVDVNFEQIRKKLLKARQRYEAKEKEEKKGNMLRFTTPHLQECHELSKPIWGNGGGGGGGGGEGSETVGVENEVDLETRKSKRDKKRKAAESKKPGKENGEMKDGAAEEPEEEEEEDVQKEVEEENVHANAVAGKQTEVQGGETKERNSNKKKRNGAGDAEHVSESLIEQLAKTALGLESSLNEETKKAIRSIEPSKVAALEEKLKELQVQEMQIFLKRAVLVHEFASMISEASVRSPTS